ncbi:unnamed protein product [Allacma fusca]|uniref:SEC14-like protein 2 n=1 Tax=Allacma fusca TaxID=39272 RepID=A0A8J2JV89_9HEXA|nr:unnamed protein product [Allacma fusca]
MTWEGPEMVTKGIPTDVNGYDYENTPVVILPFGHYDLRGIMQAGHYQATIHHVDKIWETAITKMRGRLTKEGVPVTQFTCIFDMDQLGMRTVGSIQVISLIKEAVGHFESNYPEIFRKCYVINSSRIFQILFAIVKPLLSRRTYEKVQILTTESKWKPLLLTDIPLDQLPECYGGSAWSNIHSFIGYKMKGDDSDPLNEYTVPAGDTFRVLKQISKGNCSLKWNLEIDQHDIDFYATFNEEVVVPKERISSSNQKGRIHIGSYTCVSPGVYTFHFDNSYSRFRSKGIKYSIKVEDVA